MTRRGFGTIQKAGDGRYRVFWQHGGRKCSKVVYGTKEDAELFLAKKHVESSGMLGSCTYRQYWDSVVRPSMDGLEANTVVWYESAWAFLEPHIGHVRVEDTTYMLAQGVISKAESGSRQKRAYVLWKKMCNMAVRDRILPSNPIDRTMRLKKPEKREKMLVGKDGMAAFMEGVRGCKYEPLVLLEIGGGLRHEEACALLWEDVSEQDGYALIDISKALVTVGGEKILKDTKNDRSTRIAVIGEPFASRLLSLKTAGRLIGNGTGAHGAGGYTSPLTAAHNWKRWCESHGMDYVRFGDMRSCYATIAGEAEALDSLVEMQMGHSGGSTKSAHYQQRTIRGLMLVADAIAEYLLS